MYPPQHPTWKVQAVPFGGVLVSLVVSSVAHWMKYHILLIRASGCISLLNGHIISLPDEVLSSNILTSREVSIKQIQHLANYQQEEILKFLQNWVMQSSSNLTLKRWRFNPFSHSLSSGLSYLFGNEGQSKSFLTTAWYLASCNYWLISCTAGILF